MHLFLEMDYQIKINKLKFRKLLIKAFQRRFRPELIDANIIDIIVNSTFKFNPRATTKTQSELETLVRAAIITHDSTYLSGFDSIFRHSVLATDIDSAESSILSNITTIKLRKTITPSLGQSLGYTVDFGTGNSFYNPHSGHNAHNGNN